MFRAPKVLDSAESEQLVLSKMLGRAARLNIYSFGIQIKTKQHINLVALICLLILLRNTINFTHN